MITPEGLALPLTLASRGARLGALLLDLAFLGAALIAVMLALGFTAGGLAQLGAKLAGHGAAQRALQFIVILALAALFLARNGWFLFFELGPRGATPGKRLTGIRIAARDGGRLSAEMVIARNLLRDIELFVPLALLSMLSGAEGHTAGLAALAWLVIFAGMPLFNRDRLRAGDLIAGTWVVEAPRMKLAPALSTAPPAAAGYRFSDAELAVYGEFELQMLESVLRGGQSEPLEAVAQAICAKIGWHEPGSDEVRPFLEAYYTQLRARLEARMRLGQRKANKFAGEA
jgi:uncharacterized RDD family membrane protein YckC